MIEHNPLDPVAAEAVAYIFSRALHQPNYSHARGQVRKVPNLVSKGFGLVIRRACLNDSNDTTQETCELQGCFPVD